MRTPDARPAGARGVSPMQDQAAASAPPTPARSRRAVRLLVSEYAVLIMTAAYVLAVVPFVPEMLSPTVAGNLLGDMMPLLLVAIGQTFVLIVAGIDLSVTAIVSMAAVVGASVMSAQGGYLAGGALAVPGAVLAMLGVGAGIGAINGLSVTRLNMPPFIATLATRMFFAGAAIWYVTFHSASSSIAGLPRVFTDFASTRVLGVPLTVALALVVGVAAHVALSRSRFGRWAYAIGTNREAARVSGVPVERTIVACFVVSGLCAALAAMIYASRMQTGSPIAGANILLDVIGAVVIGGTSLFGGRGKILWTVFGVLFLVVLDTSMKLLGASLFAIFIIKGSVILFAAVVDTLRTRLA